ncbi:hypothetical protein [Nocardia sp. BMG111209]|uniref:hypothetical protein n=1 Tax=Nocardia sp. BMG111209 TaxID=1160137 RepID=UPI0003619200|nr:hypothetical protein [Nocardia sp. BMG111209]
MVEQRRRSRVPRWVRALGLLLLVFGIATMHAGVFCVGGQMHDGMSGHVAAGHVAAGASEVAVHKVATHAVGAPEVATREVAVHGEVATREASGAGHGAIHACKFVLSRSVPDLGMVPLDHVGAGADDHAARLRAGLARGHRGRPPPWTVPSLAELSILRI